MVHRVLTTILLLAALAGAQTTIYIVRHAEKDTTPGVTDPGLTPKGERRSHALLRTLRSVSLDAVFATQYRRTRATVAPSAGRRGVKIESYDAARSGTFAKRLGRRKGTYLVAGHSNTVPAMLAALGVKNPPKLTESDHDDLFVVVATPDGTIVFQHLHYGEP